MSRYPFLDGVIVPAYTAANKDGSLDSKGIAEYIKWLASRKVAGSVFVRCGVGKMYTFQYDEVKAIIDAATSVKDSVPIIAGIAGIWNRDREHKADKELYTRQSVELGKYAFDKGVSGVVAVIPDGIPAPEGRDAMPEVIEYYRTLNDELPGPVLLYHTPGLEDRYALTNEALTEIASMPNIGGMKYSTADVDKLDNFINTAHAADPEFAAICGAEHGYYYALEFGGDGVIGGGCNYWPELLAETAKAFRAGDKVRSRAAFDAMLELIEFKRPLHISDDALFSYTWAKKDGFDVQVNIRRGKDIYDEVAPDQRKSLPSGPVPDKEFNILRDKILEANAKFGY